jgi:hypothetical protein
MAFGELSRNRAGGVSYLVGEGHYFAHLAIAEALFHGQAFESVAAVTELHFCATPSSVGLPKWSSRCATKYFGRVLEIVSPLVMFMVGKQVSQVLRSVLGLKGDDLMAKWSTGEAPLIEFPHPASWGAKQEGIDAAVELARKHILSIGRVTVGRRR